MQAFKTEEIVGKKSVTLQILFICAPEREHNAWYDGYHFNLGLNDEVAED